MKFLDTSFLIDILREYAPAKPLLEQLDKEGPHATSTIVVHELLTGAYGAQEPEEELKIRKNLLKTLVLLSFDLKSAEESSRIESNLRAQGKYIGGADILIAGIMKAHRIFHIVTRNVKHFKEIPGIITEEY